jgi:dihydrofolate reductase
MTGPVFSAIVAVSENNVIGMKGDMPWEKLPSDLRYFKEKTTGHWCILGRKTYNALGNRLLPGRKFIIVTRDRDFISEDSVVVHAFDDAIHHPVLAGEKEVFILGGGDIYRQSMQVLRRIYLTRIHASFEGDTFFPEISDEWRLVLEDKHLKDDKNPYDHDFLVYERM